MNQSRWESVIERIADMATGILFSWIVYKYFIFPDVLRFTPLQVVLIFTAISFFRGLAWRRFFNRGLHKVVHKYLTKLIKVIKQWQQ